MLAYALLALYHIHGLCGAILKLTGLLTCIVVFNRRWLMCRVGQNIYNVYDRMYGDFPAKNTACTPYVRINMWFWPTLMMCN
jgi:hypothetical protein